MRSPPYFCRLRRSRGFQPSTKPASNITKEVPSTSGHGVCPGRSGERRNRVSRIGVDPPDMASETAGGMVSVGRVLGADGPAAVGPGVGVGVGLGAEATLWAA